MPNKKYILTYIGILYLLIAAGPASAFGADGHRIIAAIAENHLSEKTALTLTNISGDRDLASLSLWPDKIRGSAQWKHTKSWHYINLTDLEQLKTAARSSKGDVLSALEESIANYNYPRAIFLSTSVERPWPFLCTLPLIFTNPCMWADGVIAVATWLAFSGREKPG